MNGLQLPWFPENASDHAGRVDLLFLGLLAISLGMCFILFAGIGYFTIRYRAGSSADRTPVKGRPLLLETGWTAVTALIFTGLFAWGTAVYFKNEQPRGEPLEIYVIGRQWMWEIRHPGGQREHNRLHVPLGRPVRLIMTSEDVIHSFYLPSLRIKQDVVPGRYVSLTFTATRNGRFPIYCAEYCGTEHSGMTGWLEIQDESRHAAWLAGGANLPTLARRGERLFASKGCAGCHAQGSSVRAPLLDGLHGTTRPLADGSFVQADDQYLHDSILQPLKQIAAGYEPVMPAYQGQLTETEVIELVEYLKSLRMIPQRPQAR